MPLHPQVHVLFDNATIVRYIDTKWRTASPYSAKFSQTRCWNLTMLFITDVHMLRSLCLTLVVYILFTCSRMYFLVVTGMTKLALLIDFYPDLLLCVYPWFCLMPVMINVNNGEISLDVVMINFPNSFCLCAVPAFCISLNLCTSFLKPIVQIFDPPWLISWCIGQQLALGAIL